MGMAVFALLEVFNRPKERQNFFLKGLLLLLLLHFAGELFVYSGAYVYAPSLVGVHLPFRVLLGPALFFYAHATMSPDKTIGKRIWAITLYGPILALLALLSFIFIISTEEKLTSANLALIPL